jgi:SAM-dependent methyltransferase
MTKQLVFDAGDAQRITSARKEPLRAILPLLRESLPLQTAIDVGCGVGYFAAFLHEMGFQVTAVDGRPDNVIEGRERYADISFHVGDAEDPEIAKLGTFDLVLCFGLLYHLENPFRAIRNLYALTSKILFLESMCVPNDSSVFYLRDEPNGEDQSLTSAALYASENALAKMCYQAGFSFVYALTKLPDHEDFKTTLWRKRVRTMLIASRIPLHVACSRQVPEPPGEGNIWATRWQRWRTRLHLGRLKHLVQSQPSQVKRSAD